MSAPERESKPPAGMPLLANLLRPLRPKIAIAVAATITSTVAALVPPYLAGRVINNVIVTGSSSDLVVIAIALIVALAISWIASTVETLMIGEVGVRALVDLRERIAAKLHRLPMSYYDRESAGRMISRMTNDVESLNTLVSGGLNQLTSSLLILVGTMIVMTLLDWRLAIVSLFVFPLLAVLSILIDRRTRPGWGKASNAMGTVTAYAQEGFAGQDVVRGFGQEERHLEGFNKTTKDAELAFQTPMTFSQFFGPTAEFALPLGIAAVLAFAADEVAGGALEVGTVVTFIAYLRQAMAPLPQLAWLFSVLQQGITALHQIGDLLDAPEDPGQLPGRAPAPELAGAVSLERLSFAYVEDKLVLRDIDLDIAQGESVAFVGESGCGKSTIVKLLMGFYVPQRGRIVIDSHDLQELDLRSVRAQVGYVPQEAFLFPGTVADNIAWGRDAANGDARTAAASVGVLDVLEALPDGLETQLGEGGAGLSAGQRQLVALARAMFTDPRLMVLDEATSNIDVATETHVQEGIERLMEGRTSIVIAHRLSTIQRADRIVVIDRGQIVEMGSPAELRASGGRYARLESQSEQQQADG